ncbi:Pentatricopeptide repeat-containing protein [Thalictrum thalictroides]|uniref:Pentatricopeptide repeat-containing protein n=1 Tax=Thalictrum thalictroides TaxID=46969 RepID=A0A7J6WQR8_THATH|nr:Pentatricopeptide repeat-containing protein [Thalictrum thalictroides]
MIQCFTANAIYDDPIVLYCQMRDIGIKPDNYTYPFVLKDCGHLRDIGLGKVIHKDVIVFGYESDVFVGNSLVTMYGKFELGEFSRQVFDEMPDRSIVSWSAMIGAYAQNGLYEEGLLLFYGMLDERILPSKGAILNVMSCVRRENEAAEIRNIVVDNGLDADHSVQNAVIRMYSRCGRVDIARRIFDGIIDKDMVLWTSMIEAYAQVELYIEALELFKQMKLQKIQFDFVTILSVVRACSVLASFRQARFLHGYVIRSLYQCESMLDTALIDLYVKSGSLEYARKIFDKLSDRNVVSWSTMISGYGMHGRGTEALNLFDQMKGSVQPDHITFVSVLSACSHSGLMGEGWRHFRSMAREFGLTPKSEHYACMVDLLGRSGMLNEAMELIKKMPMKPDSGVWGSLLGACRIHSNIKFAELAAKSLFELDAENPGRYVLLSNIYMSSGKREEADLIRGLMKHRKLRKTAGHTVIEIKNKIYTFVVGDRSNPQTELIYEELEKLMNRIRKVGYVPDTNFTLHDVEEEIKDKMLYLHSEKLAIVFGLLNSGPTSVIQIMKNLRVCGDCHTATKFISKVTNREIVVRDAHRFHHFKEGACSCGDYW